MGDSTKITVVIHKEVEEMLRDYIRKKYRRPFGKLSEVMEEAIIKYIKEESSKDKD